MILMISVPKFEAAEAELLTDAVPGKRGNVTGERRGAVGFVEPNHMVVFCLNFFVRPLFSEAALL